jgi:TatD DNase family protein
LCLENLRQFGVQGGRAGGLVPLVDIGINVNARSNVPRILLRSAAAGVGHVVLTGTSVKGSEQAAAVARDMSGKHAGVSVFFTAGVHPHDSGSNTCDARNCDRLRALHSNPLCVAVGEAGLDYDRMKAPPEVQLRWFDAQVGMAAAAGKPLFVHERDLDARKGSLIGSHEDLCRVLDAHTGRTGRTAAGKVADKVADKVAGTRGEGGCGAEEGGTEPELVPEGGKLLLRPEQVCIHCFTGTEEHLRDYVASGYMIGLTGFVGMGKRGAALRQALGRGALPLDRLMLETDSPYMRPDGVAGGVARGIGMRGGRDNEPCCLPAVVRAVAAAMGLPEREVALAATRNTAVFFGIECGGVGAAGSGSADVTAAAAGAAVAAGAAPPPPPPAFSSNPLALAPGAGTAAQEQQEWPVLGSPPAARPAARAVAAKPKPGAAVRVGECVRVAALALGSQSAAKPSCPMMSIPAVVYAGAAAPPNQVPSYRSDFPR